MKGDNELLKQQISQKQNAVDEQLVLIEKLSKTVQVHENKDKVQRAMFKV